MIRRKRLSLAISQAIGLGLFAIQGSQAATFFVDNTSDIDNGNTDPGNVTLREAINLANASPDVDSIFFVGPTFDSQQTIILTNGELTISNPVTIFGPGANRLTIDGNADERVLDINNGDNGSNINVTISGLRFANGTGTGAADNERGGCIVSFENLTLNNSIVTGCTATVDGGGIWSRVGTLAAQTIQPCMANSALFKGGGIYTA